MRASFLLGLGLGTVICGISRGEETFPYRVTVVHQGVPVRSGPGSSFYVTDLLPGGSSVEVYRREEGGWLGIRPPAGSFSWVRREALDPTNQPGIARILRNDTICRVGSRVAEIQEHVGQVYLQQDERVEVAEQPPVDTQTARRLEAEGWRRIAPPAGEFRWVQAGDLERRNEPPAKIRLAAAEVQPRVAGEPEYAVRKAGHVDARPADASSLSTAQVIQAVAQQATGSDADKPAPAGDSDGGAEPGRAEPAESIPVFEEREPEAEASMQEPANWEPRGGISVEDLWDVEMRLASTAAREVARWRLQPLRDRVEAILPRLKTDGERQQADRLLERIAQYEELQNRFAQAGEIAPLAEPAPLRGPTGAVPPPAWEDALRSRFDGSGWLVPVHSTRRAAPPYALLDDEGEVLQYVAPSPGLNLHRYLRKRVGLYGQRGHAAALNKPLITAERVVDLNRHLR